MSLQLIGLIIMGCAALGLIHSSRASFIVLCVACLLQAAAAIFVGGGGNITPGHLALGFFALAVIMRQRGLAASFSTLTFPRAGFWLAMATLWSVFTALIMPRLFFGMFEVTPLGIANSFGVIAPIPLTPVSSNINQSIYYIGNLAAFMTVAGMCRTHSLLKTGAIGVLVAIVANLGLVLIDQATFAIGRPDLLDFIRNAEYGQLFHATVLGMKRITGSFPEASSYAAAAMGLMAFALRLWRGGVMTKWTGPLALAVFATLLLSTSTTAYIALGAYVVIIYSMVLSGYDPARPRDRGAFGRKSIFIAAGPVSVVLIGGLFAVRPDILEGLTEFLDMSVTSKLTSDSGEERSEWNMRGIETILNSYGLGAGLGSVRTSSFLIGLPANVGLVGTLLFAAFFARIFKPPRGPDVGAAQNQSEQIAAGARSACFGILLAACASGGTADLGIMFFIFAGLASASVFQTVNFDKAGFATPMPEPYLAQKPARRAIRGGSVRT